MGYAVRVVILLLRIAYSIISSAKRRRLIRMGERLALAKELRKIADASHVATEVDRRVAIMDDVEIMKVAVEEDWLYD